MRHVSVVKLRKWLFKNERTLVSQLHAVEKYHCVNMEAVGAFLSVLVVSGVSGDCPGADLCITAPQKIQALTGSCVWISCSFKPVPTKETLSGVWIKNIPQFGQNPNNVIFNSTNKNNIYSGEIRGNLKEQNCSTVFDNVQTNFTDKYFFRIESKSFKATASFNSVYINVTDSPPSPTLEIPPDLKENKSVTLTCSAPTPCPGSTPRLTWHLQQDPPNEMKKNPDGTFTTRIKRTFILSDRDDGSSVSCSATYPVNEGQEKTVEKIVSLSVSYAPKDTVVSISRSEGHQVNMTCSSRAKPSVSRFSWNKKNLDKDMEVAEGADLSVTFTDGDIYFCEAFNAVGHQRSAEIQLTEKSLLWKPIVGGIVGFVLLVCAVVIFVCLLKSKRPSVPQTPRSAGGVHVDPQSDGENIHYGEINFSKRRHEASSSLVPQDGGRKQDTVYAQVNVSMSTEGHEDIYAQVKKN